MRHGALGGAVATRVRDSLYETRGIGGWLQELETSCMRHGALGGGYKSWRHPV